MARQITLNKLGGKAPFADNGLKLSKSIRIDEIEMHEDFQSLFPIKEDILNRLVDSMKEKGFKGNHPVDIWFKTDDDGTVHKYLIDGHTRLQAAKLAGLESIPYFEFHFETFDEALKEALGEQVNRRNLEGADLLNAVRKLYGTDFIQNTEGKKSEAIAEVLGVSPRTAAKAISVMKDNDEELISQIENNELTVHKAYEKKHPKKSNKTEYKEEVETNDLNNDEIDFLESENEGNPGSVYVRSRDMSEKFIPPAEDPVDKRLIERYKEGFVAGFKKCFSEVSYQVFEKIIELLKEGKTCEEIENNELFEDFSFNVLAPKLDFPISDEELLKRFN